MAGKWQQHQVWDGTYKIDDLLDVHEMLVIQAENQERARIAQSGKGAG